MCTSLPFHAHNAPYWSRGSSGGGFLLAAAARTAEPPRRPFAPPAALAQGRSPPDRGPDVIYVPTPPETVDAMLKMAEVKIRPSI
jgi:hypothetical protein